MLDIIQNNPFRILGVYIDASAAEIKRNETKIRRYLEVGKSVTFPTDELGNLPAPARSSESLDKALASINLPNEKLYHALFWYSKDNSCLFNDAIDDILSGVLDEALGAYTNVLYNEECFSSLQKIILGNILFETSEVIGLCLDGFFTIEKSKNMLELCEAFLHPQDYETAKNIITARPVDEINACLSSTKNADQSTPAKCLDAGVKLMNSAKQPLADLRALLDESDSDYQRIADSLAKQILQCGINYFNGSDDDDSIEKALEIQEYALSIAVGKLTKDRCRQNVDILLKQKKESPPAEVKDEHAKIMEEIKDFNSKPDTIAHALTLLKNTKSCLKTIRRKLERDNEYYRSISTTLAENALHNVIEVVNEALKQLEEDVIERQVKMKFPPKPQSAFTYGSRMNSAVAAVLQAQFRKEFGFDIPNPEDEYRMKLKRDAATNARLVLVKAWDIIKLIDVMHLEKEFVEKHFNPNRTALQKLCQQAGISTPKGEYVYDNIGKYVFMSVIIVEVIWAVIAVVWGKDEFWSVMLVSLGAWLMPINLLPVWGLVSLMKYIEKSRYE